MSSYPILLGLVFGFNALALVLAVKAAIELGYVWLRPLVAKDRTPVSETRLSLTRFTAFGALLSALIARLMAQPFVMIQEAGTTNGLIPTAGLLPIVLTGLLFVAAVLTVRLRVFRSRVEVPLFAGGRRQIIQLAATLFTVMLFVTGYTTGFTALALAEAQGRGLDAQVAGKLHLATAEAALQRHQAGCYRADVSPQDVIRSLRASVSAPATGEPQHSEVLPARIAEDPCDPDLALWPGETELLR